jgi:hypothetical protein
VLKRLFGLGSKELARLSIPGDATVELPAGRVKVRYEQVRESAAPLGTLEVQTPGAHRVTVSQEAERPQPVLVLLA